LHLGLTGGLAATAVVGVAASGSASAATGTTALPRVSDTAVTVPSLPDLHGLLMIGSRGSYVRLAQGQLGVATDGIFGPITRGAVIRFQSSRGLTVDGIIGPVTWAALGRSAPTTSHPSAHPLLRQGDRGGAVADVQRRLEISADGVFGPVTLSAVRAFQSAHGLVVDGVVGAHTWSALERVGSWHYGGGSASVASASSVGARAVALASQQAGVPYVYGGASPAGFDCSGLVKYVFGQLGYSLPHNADMQYHAVRHVAKSNLQVGDIVFMPNSRGYITHDGIYAGNGYWWVAPHTGEVVQKQRIYTSRYLVGRVG
jgi:cell wall-associated NlpC family hydrolase